MDTTLIYQNRRHENQKVYLKKGVTIPESFKDDDEKAYLYLCHILDKDTGKYWIKIGKACDVYKRMTEHANDRKTEVILVWVSNAYTTYTVLKAEKTFILDGKDNSDWVYVRNDRFFVPDECTMVEVLVKKTFVITW